MSAYIDGPHSGASLSSARSVASSGPGIVGACHLQSEYGPVCPQTNPCNQQHGRLDVLGPGASSASSLHLEEPQLEDKVIARVSERESLQAAAFPSLLQRWD